MFVPIAPRQAGAALDRYVQLLAAPPNNDCWKIAYRAGTLSWVPDFDTPDRTLVSWDANGSSTTGMEQRNATGLTQAETGTASVATLLTGVAKTRVAQYASAAVLNDIAGWHSSAAEPVCIPETTELVLFDVVTPSALTTVRWWFGLTNQSVATMGAGANPAGHRLMIRYDTSVPDPGYVLSSKDGATHTTTSLGGTPNATEAISFLFSRSRTSSQAWQVWRSSGRGTWTLLASITSGGPADATDLYAAMSVTALAGSSREARLARVRVLRH